MSTVCELGNGLFEIVDLAKFSHKKWWIFPVRFLGQFTRPGKWKSSETGRIREKNGIVWPRKMCGNCRFWPSST